VFRISGKCTKWQTYYTSRCLQSDNDLRRLTDLLHKSMSVKWQRFAQIDRLSTQVDVCKVTTICADWQTYYTSRRLQSDNDLRRLTDLLHKSISAKWQRFAQIDRLTTQVDVCKVTTICADWQTYYTSRCLQSDNDLRRFVLERFLALTSAICPDDVSSKHLPNAGSLQRDYTALHPRRQSSSDPPSGQLHISPASYSLGPVFKSLPGDRLS
jgi:hypothetical protein